jgi:hypothetical protein
MNQQQLPFTFRFSEKLENHLGVFDDGLLQWCQHDVGNRSRYRLAMSLTALTTVEAGILLLFVLYGAGFYQAACVWNVHVLALSLISQVPKRFVRRIRPYLQRRAVALRQDRTSSFPSRGVTCALVYPVALGRAMLDRNFSTGQKAGALWVSAVYGAALILTMATAWARVHLGVHFPSDAVGGLLQGMLVLSVTQDRLYEFCLERRSFQALFGVPRCRLDGLRLLGMSALGVGLLVLAELPGLQLWGKASYVFGALWALNALRASGLCFEPSQRPWRNRFEGTLWGASAGIAVLLIGMRLARRSQRSRNPGGPPLEDFQKTIASQVLIFVIVYVLGLAYLLFSPTVLAWIGSLRVHR